MYNSVLQYKKKRKTEFCSILSILQITIFSRNPCKSKRLKININRKRNFFSEKTRIINLKHEKKILKNNIMATSVVLRC